MILCGTEHRRTTWLHEGAASDDVGTAPNDVLRSLAAAGMTRAYDGGVFL